MWLLRSLLSLLILSLLTGCYLSGKKELPREIAETEQEPAADNPDLKEFNPGKIQGFYHAYNAVPARGQIDFDLGLSTQGENVTLVVRLKNDASYPVRLDFKDGEMFEIILEGNGSYHWTDNHYVMNASHTLQFKPGEKKRFVYTTTKQQLLQHLPPGGYTVRVRSNSSQPFEATTGFSL
jgi:hypothetical protein